MLPPDWLVAWSQLAAVLIGIVATVLGLLKGKELINRKIVQLDCEIDQLNYEKAQRPQPK